MKFDAAAFGKEMGVMIKELVARETIQLTLLVRELEDRIALVEARADALAAENATLLELVGEAEVKAGANPQHAHI